MDEKLLWVYLITFLTSSVKFIFGPASGFLMGLRFWELFFLSVAGMMSSVTLITFFGLWLRARWRRFFWKKRRPRRFSRRTRQTVRIWRYYGIWGVALLTPVIFSPVVGTMIAVSFGERKERILFHMAWSAILWAAILSFIFHYWGHDALELLKPFIGEIKPNGSA